jgi:hypothetical protein
MVWGKATANEMGLSRRPGDRKAKELKYKPCEAAKQANWSRRCLYRYRDSDEERNYKNWLNEKKRPEVSQRPHSECTQDNLDAGATRILCLLTFDYQENNGRKKTNPSP